MIRSMVVGSFWDLGCCHGSVGQAFVFRASGREIRRRWTVGVLLGRFEFQKPEYSKLGRIIWGGMRWVA